MLDQALDVAIVDYNLGNLYSVKHACTYVGLNAEISSSVEVIRNARAVILPGVGAYGDAMTTLHRLGLVDVLRDIAFSGKLLVGICLGIQLLMTESYEFGRHQGLDIIKGSVVPFDNPHKGERFLKVPQIGWNRIFSTGQPWAGTPMADIDSGQHMYFVHSYIVQPEDPDVILATSHYGNVEFCSSLQYGNVFACQFHPERSGAEGLKLYRNLAHLIHTNSEVI